MIEIDNYNWTFPSKNSFKIEHQIALQYLKNMTKIDK